MFKDRPGRRSESDLTGAGVDAGAHSEAVAVEVDGAILISTFPGLSTVPSTELAC